MSTPQDLRASRRISTGIAVEVIWRTPQGNTSRETAIAAEVSPHGGLLEMKGQPAVDSPLELENKATGVSAKARVASHRHLPNGLWRGVGIEFEGPSHGIWGLGFQLKYTSAELVELEEAIKAGGVDLRVLREFRDAVDHIRKTAWVVYEWQERQALGRDAETVIALLIRERIRRATQINHDLADDLRSHTVGRQTSGVANLYQALGELHQILAPLLEGPASR